MWCEEGRDSLVKAFRIMTLSVVLICCFMAVAAASAFRVGDQGSDVAEIQGQLASLGYDVTADGDFGPATAEAVKAFQASQGLDADGLVKSGNYFLYYSTSQNKWAVSNSASDSHTGYLYASSPGRAARNLAFSSMSVTHDLATQGTNVQEPTLSGVTDGVEYSSKNTSIATVNAATGEVTLAGKTGTVVITASAPKTDTYKAEEVNYTLHVTDSSAPVTGDTYVKVTSASDLVAGAKYILVYESESKVFKPTLNGSNFTTTGNALDVYISDETIVSDDLMDCQMTLEDGYYFYIASVSRYLYPTYNNMGAEGTKSSSHSFSISISNGTATISRTSNNSTYNLRYSTSNSYFQSSSSSANVALYKLDNP